MKYSFVFALVIFSTQVEAQGKFNPQEKTVELTYEDLEQELALKRKMESPSSSSGFPGFRQVDLGFGYSFAFMNYDLSKRSYGFSTSGVDLRLIGQIENSSWQLETGFKNFSQSRDGSATASAQVLHGNLQYLIPIENRMSYFIGTGPSLHLISISDSFQRRSPHEWSLNLATGFRGRLSPKWNWNLDLKAHSPMSGHVLKNGLETGLSVSTSL